MRKVLTDWAAKPSSTPQLGQFHLLMKVPIPRDMLDIHCDMVMVIIHDLKLGVIYAPKRIGLDQRASAMAVA